MHKYVDKHTHKGKDTKIGLFSSLVILFLSIQSLNGWCLSGETENHIQILTSLASIWGQLEIPENVANIIQKVEINCSSLSFPPTLKKHPTNYWPQTYTQISFMTPENWVIQKHNIHILLSIYRLLVKVHKLSYYWHMPFTGSKTQTGINGKQLISNLVMIFKISENMPGIPDTTNETSVHV